MQSKTIVLGVSGGIAAYKACELASRLTQNGAEVHVVMTRAAQKFVAPLTFQALTHQPVHTSLWPKSANSEKSSQADNFAGMAHIGLADRADVVIIAPASADIIARLSQGLADDLLTTICLATRAPILIAPAMNPQMLAHPATQKNLQTLQEFGYKIIDPESGRMACEHIGSGRLPSSDALIQALNEVLQPRRDLGNLTILVTAGGTREMLDPVRFIGNKSSGRMGFAIAENAARRGAKVVLISGPTTLSTPPNVQRIDVSTTLEMFEVVTKFAAQADVIIAAAAPADFRAEAPKVQKIKKQGDEKLTLELVPNPDIIAEVGRNKTARQIVIGFAAETENVVEEARRKLQAKNLDAILANDVSQTDSGFDVSTNRVTWLTAEVCEAWPLLQKSEVAARILDKVAQLLQQKTTTPERAR